MHSNNKLPPEPTKLIDFQHNHGIVSEKYNSTQILPNVFTVQFRELNGNRTQLKDYRWVVYTKKGNIYGHQACLSCHKSHNGVLKREPSKHYNQSQFEEGMGLHSFKQSRCILSNKCLNLLLSKASRPSAASG